jgi:hypothetical protein
MNLSALVASTLFAGMIAPAAGPVFGTVRVCVEPGSATPFVVTQAEAKAAAMFAEIAVKIQWLHGRRECQARPNETILIRLSSQAPADFLPGSLAYARPYEGTHIKVFLDRVVQTTEPRRRPALLAHVLVHEVGHILEGVNRHSEQGVMKARWDEFDFMQMSWKPLPFAPLDVLLIHTGLDARASRMAQR